MRMNRRNFVAKAGLGAATLGITPALSLSSCTVPEKSRDPENDGQVLFIGDDIALAQTNYGKVKGYMMNSVYSFLGIPYAADASGKNRFMPPQEPKPWKEVRPAVYPGNSAPQDIYDRKPENYYSFVDHWNYDEVSEDCLRLNIWTPGLTDGGKRPVLVWLHGGGFSKGNGLEQDGYHGESFSKYGNVVFCSINHRLGPIGFSDFSAIGGEKYKHSGNVGMLDVLAALKWINQNIENFGGDPGNVTVMGQSGGGAKVCVVAAMPEAKGLVHKAVALSGSDVKGVDRTYSQELGRYILQEANLTPSQIDQLQELPWKEYLVLANRAAKRMEQERGGPGMRRGGFGPVADGLHLPEGQFYADASLASPNVPMLLCTTFHEWAPGRTEPELENITLEGVIDKLRSAYGDKAAEIVSAYDKTFPNRKPIEIWSLIVSNREAVIRTANAKLKQNAPVYMAWFGWSSPLFNHRMRSFHCLDISFWFLNTDRMVTHTGGGARPRNLAKKMAGALLNFMHKGDPNGADLPNWPQYTLEKGETMVLNDECKVEYDPDREARQKLS
ncbi:carboxylesterase/lipase family protein [Sabulibacter ruber]|uniref:carboxylesterase/lipase family protein n=1 Tax=Sabulibacter ruber TaxID=2811901 RepID=UPI001A9745A0|nr:carboxylesterase family protein [Sabulibacter ruber]